MFFFSCGSLNKLITRQSLYSAASSCSSASSTNEGCVYKLPNPKPILLVQKILKTFDNKGCSFITFVLYDGQNVAFGLVTSTLINKTLTYNSVDVEFKEGTVIQLEEYSIANSKNEDLCSIAGEFQYLIQYLDRSKVVMVVLEKFSVLGNDESIERARLKAEAEELAKEMESKKRREEEEKRIEQARIDQAESIKEFDRVLSKYSSSSSLSKQHRRYKEIEQLSSNKRQQQQQQQQATLFGKRDEVVKVDDDDYEETTATTSSAVNLKKKNAGGRDIISAAFDNDDDDDDDDDNNDVGDNDDENDGGDNDYKDLVRGGGGAAAAAAASAAGSSFVHDQEEYKPHKIAELNSDMSRLNTWSLRVCLSEISSIREWDNKNSSGTTMRLQFFDETGYIELAFFDKYCQFCSKNNLRENIVYTIRNASIKTSKKPLKVWHDKNNSIYDLHFNRNTSVIPDPDQTPIEKLFKKKKKASNAKQRQPTTMTTTTTLHTNEEKREKQQQPPPAQCLLQQQPPKSLKQLLQQQQQQQQQQQYQPCQPHLQLQQPQYGPRPEYIHLFAIYDIEIGSFINTTAIVTKIGKLDSIKKHGKVALPLRRLEIIDDSINEAVTITLWGKQAIDCNIKYGNIYLFTDVELTNFNSRSLSIVKKSGFLNVTGYFNVTGVEVLAMWWRENKHRFPPEERQDTIVDCLYNSKKRKQTGRLDDRDRDRDGNDADDDVVDNEKEKSNRDSKEKKRPKF